MPDVKDKRHKCCRKWLILLLLIVAIVLGIIIVRRWTHPTFIVPIDFAQLGLPPIAPVDMSSLTPSA